MEALCLYPKQHDKKKEALGQANPGETVQTARSQGRQLRRTLDAYRRKLSTCGPKRRGGRLDPFGGTLVGSPVFHEC